MYRVIYLYDFSTSSPPPFPPPSGEAFLYRHSCFSSSSFPRRRESSSLPVTANATPKRSLPVHILEKDTPLLNCCQRKTGALFKPFAELLPRQSPVSGLIPSQTPPRLHIYPLPLTGAFLCPLSVGERLSFCPLSLGERARVRALKTTPPLYLPIISLAPLRTNPILPPLVLRKYYGKTNFQPNFKSSIPASIAAILK